MIATSSVSPNHKVKCLKWMNASGPSREARRVPPRPVNEEKLQLFLSKACWYAGVCASFGLVLSSFLHISVFHALVSI